MREIVEDISHNKNTIITNISLSFYIKSILWLLLKLPGLFIFQGLG